MRPPTAQSSDWTRARTRGSGCPSRAKSCGTTPRQATGGVRSKPRTKSSNNCDEGGTGGTARSLKGAQQPRQQVRRVPQSSGTNDRLSLCAKALDPCVPVWGATLLLSALRAAEADAVARRLPRAVRAAPRTIAYTRRMPKRPCKAARAAGGADADTGHVVAWPHSPYSVRGLPRRHRDSVRSIRERLSR